MRQAIHYYFILSLLFLWACGSGSDPDPDPEPKPTASFTFSPASPKVNESVTFTSTTANVESFEWSSNPAGFSSTDKNPSHAFAEAGNYTITLKVTGPGGSTSTSKTVSVESIEPEVNFTFSPSNPIQGQAISFTSTTANTTSLEWSSEPAGLSSTEANPSHTFAAAGTYQITLKGKGDNGEKSITKEVTVAAPLVEASFTFSPENPIKGEQVQFSNTSKEASSYQWSSKPTGFSSTDENPSFTFNTVGDYEITLIAKDAFGNEASTSQTISVKEQAPTVDFSFSPESPIKGQEISFTSTATDATSFEWSSDPVGFSSSNENPKHTFAVAGTYSVTLKVTGLGGITSITKSITVADASLVAGFTFSPESPVKGDKVEFSNTSQGASTYQWTSNPAGFSSTDKNPSFTFNTAGDYTISLVAKDDFGNESNTSKTITVSEPAPTVDFSFSPASPTKGQEISFTSTTTDATSFEWSSDPVGFSSSDENPKHTFTEAGTYSVTLKATGLGGTTSTTKSITVADASLVAGFTFSPESPVKGDKVEFSNTSQGASTYQWTSSPTGFSSTDENPSFTFNTAGDYTISLVVKDAFGNEASASKTLTVSEPVPMVDFSFSPESPKAGESITFTSTTTDATSFEWSSDPSGFSATDENPSHTFADAGNYKVTLKATGPGGSTSVTKTISVSEVSSSGTACSDGNPCDLPLCYVTKTVTTTSGVSVTSEFEYKTVADKKVVAKLTVSSLGTTSVSTYDYDDRARNTKITSVTETTAGTITTITESEWNECQKIKDKSFDANGVLQSYTTYEYDGSGRLVKNTSFDANDVKTGHTEFSDFTAQDQAQNQKAFDENGTLVSDATLTYKNCQPETIVGKDGSGTKVLDQVNEFNSNRFISKSTSTTTISQAGFNFTVTAVTTYEYNCD